VNAADFRSRYSSTDTARALREALTNPVDLLTALELVHGPRDFQRQGSGVLIRCPAHEEQTPSCSVRVGPDGTIAAKCHACGWSGDALTLIAIARGLDVKADFRAVLEQAAEIAGRLDLLDADVAPSPARKPPPAPKPPPTYPPRAEVSSLLESCVPVTADEAVRLYLEGRSLDAERVDALGLGQALPVDATAPAWARYGRPWTITGHRLMFAVVDHTGEVRSVRAGRVVDGAGQKRVAPKEYSIGGLVLANEQARAMLRGEGAHDRVVVVEGEPDWLTWATRTSLPVIGVLSGSWSRDLAARIPDGAKVVIRTHHDPAGDKYAAEVRISLAGRCRLMRSSACGEGMDENDGLIAGLLPDDPFEGAVDMIDPLDRPDSSSDATTAAAVVDVIRIGVDLHRVVDEAVSALGRAPSIFQRDGQLVHVVRVPESEADAATLAGTPQIRPVAIPTLRERLSSVVQWEKHDGRSKGWKPTTPADTVVSAVAMRGQWKGLRPIVGVIETPSLRPDGSVIQTAGYDAPTGFVLVPSDTFPQVPDRPSQEDARRALAELAEPLSDFPYPSEAHRSATLAAVLTLVGRPAIEGSVPGFIFDASTRGSGKTLQADVVSLIATGRVSSKMGYPTDDEELEKVLGAYALRGALLINFDNITRPFGGGPLDRCLTATDSVELRVLGRSEVPSLRWRATVLATGNNVELVGDTSRRVLFSRLEPSEENPEHRADFRIADLRAWVRERRARLVVAALTILRAYVVAGRPNVGVKSWGSFEQWSSLVPAALVWAGAANPMATRPSEDASMEPEKAALMTLLANWSRLAGNDGITAKGAVGALYPVMRQPGPPDGFDDLRDAIEILTSAQSGKPPTPARVGYALRKARKRNVGGRHIDVRVDRNGVCQWFVAGATLRQHEGGSPASHAGSVSECGGCGG
jgi:hypothetical protein